MSGKVFVWMKSQTTNQKCSARAVPPVTVLHIDDEKRPVRQHTLMAEARLVEGKLVYDGRRLL